MKISIHTTRLNFDFETKPKTKPAQDDPDTGRKLSSAEKIAAQVHGWQPFGAENTTKA